MIRSLQRTLIVMSVAILAGGGFVWGRARGIEAAPAHSRRSVSRVLTANAETNGLFKTIGLQDAGGDPDPARTFEAVLDRVQNDYALKIQPDSKLSNGAIAQMLASLNDPKTSFLDPKMRAAKRDALLGRYEGIGATLLVVKAKKDKYDYLNLTVVDVAPGSPAEKAGLQSGDIIDSINDKWVISRSTLLDADRLQKEQKNKTKTDAELKEEAKQITEKFQKGYLISKALPLLTTGTGKTLKIAVMRGGQAAPVVATVQTAVTQVEPVEFKMLDKQIGVLTVRQFNGKATEQFQQAIEKNGADLKGLVVDLRGNPGGVRAATADLNGYQSALTLLSLISDHPTVQIASRPKQHEAIPIADARKVTAPLVVLTDSGTANVAENGRRDAANRE